MSTLLLASQAEGSLSMSIGMYCAAFDKYSETYISSVPGLSSGPYQNLRRRRPLHTSKPGFSLIENSIDTLQKHIPKDIERQTPTRLNSTIDHAITRISEGEVLLLDREQI